MSSNYYAVKVGRNIGIYKTWDECKKEIDGFNGAKYKKFSTESEALAFINGTIIINKQLIFDNSRVIYCDGACNNFTKPYAYGSVVDHFSKDLIKPYSSLFPDMELIELDLPVGRRLLIKCKFNDVSIQQNNSAELLAAVASMRIALYLINNNYPIQYIFCDSTLIINHWSKRIKDESAAKMDPNKLKYINELIKLNREFELYGGSLYKIESDKNFSDLGWHRS